MTEFTTTHIIEAGGESIEVMLPEAPGPAYQRNEWDTESPADYEVTEAGAWTFQGQAFAGTVRAV